MARLAVPVIVVCIGEGGSGGALALGVGNTVLMLENAVYSVISPESCAAIIYRDSGQGRAGRGRAAADRAKTCWSWADRRHRSRAARRRAGRSAMRRPEFLRQHLLARLDELTRPEPRPAGGTPLRQVPPDGEFLRVKKTIWMAIAFAVVVLGFLVFSSFRHDRVRCRGLHDVQRRTRLPHGAGADREGRAAHGHHNACAQLASGVTEPISARTRRPIGALADAVIPNASDPSAKSAYASVYGWHRAERPGVK